MWGVNKYRAKKTTVDNVTFDSKREATRYIYLRDAQKRGEISNLRMQVKYLLIPAQYEQDRTGRMAGRIRGRLLEREVSYIADFVYINEDGEEVVEDVKGMRTAVWVLKRKLMLYVHNIRVWEV